MINVTWKIERMECYPEINTFTDVVFNVHWRVNGQEEQYYATNYGSVTLTIPNEGDSFVPYNELTFDQVIQWVKNTMGETTVANIEQSVINQIEKQKNPPVVVLPLPWDSLNTVDTSMNVEISTTNENNTDTFMNVEISTLNNGDINEQN